MSKLHSRSWNPICSKYNIQSEEKMRKIDAVYRVILSYNIRRGSNWFAGITSYFLSTFCWISVFFCPVHTSVFQNKVISVYHSIKWMLLRWDISESIRHFSHSFTSGELNDEKSNLMIDEWWKSRWDNQENERRKILDLLESNLHRHREKSCFQRFSFHLRNKKTE